MREYPFDPATDPIAYLVQINRIDATAFFMTTWPQTILAPLPPPNDTSDVTWRPGVGLKIYDIAERNDGTPASTQISFSTYTGGYIDPTEVAYDMFSEADVFIYVCNPLAPSETAFHFYGRIGNKRKPVHDVVTFELINPRSLPRFNLVQQYTPMCRFPFGGGWSFCGMPVMSGGVTGAGDELRSLSVTLGETTTILTGTSPTGFGNVYFEATTPGITAASAPTFDYTVGNTTIDGSVVWTARNAWERACEIATIVDRHTVTLVDHPDPRDVDGWYAPGMIMPVTGRNKNRPFQIGLWTQSIKQATCYRPIGLGTVAGDLALIWPDCDKTLDMCVNKYSNGRRYGGFPYYEGAKAAALQSG